MHKQLNPTPGRRLAELGITLPPAPKPVASYVPALIKDDLLYVSGQIPIRDSQIMALGAVPGQVSIETAQECARQCTINGLAAANAALQTRGGLNEIVRVLRVGCWV
ncbi:MAG: RidA family protein, partial [Phycisphaerales bacterium]